jgi:hypothetical protein
MRPMHMRSDKIITLLARIQTGPIQTVAELGARGQSNQKRGRNALERNDYMSGVFTVVVLHYQIRWCFISNCSTLQR